VALNNYETVYMRAGIHQRAGRADHPEDQADHRRASGSFTARTAGAPPLAYAIQSHRRAFIQSHLLRGTFRGAGDRASLQRDGLDHPDLTIRVIKKNKTFRPRRERPAGAAESSGRPGGRSYSPRPGPMRRQGRNPRSLQRSGRGRGPPSPILLIKEQGQRPHIRRRRRSGAGINRGRSTRMTQQTLRLLQMNDVRLSAASPATRGALHPEGQAVARLDLAVNRRFKDGWANGAKKRRLSRSRCGATRLSAARNA